MLWRMYAVLDIKAAFFHTPFSVRSEVDAIRSVVQAAGDKASPLGMYPTDFVLHQLGTFDDGNGSVVADMQPVGLVADLMKK